LDTTIDSTTFVADAGSAAALVIDDVISADDGSLVDALAIAGALGTPNVDDNFFSVNFFGGDNLFSDTGIGNVTVLDLDQIDTAEVTIEFRNFGPDGDDTVSRITIEILTLTVDGAGRSITVTCLPDTNENGEIDFGDFNAWIGLFNADDFRADINLDGDVTPADFNAWVTAYNRGC
ncbi:MAG: GC-type dockerin domain-anchored protein, partial [Planctomycetota bacterium]